MRQGLRAAVAALTVGLGCGWWPAAAQEPLPLFDAHVHYSRPAWSAFSVEAVAKALGEAGVARALVSSTPDDGSRMLAGADPARFVAALRPYRDGTDGASWYRDDSVVAYVEERLGTGSYVAIGEFHLLEAAAADSPVVRRIAALAVARDIFLYVHSDAGPIGALFRIEPRARILWAHAGMGEPPSTVGALLDRHPNLMVELSFRAGDIAPGEAIAPAWRDLLVRHADRFVVGTDTYVNPRWESYGRLIAEHRRWLAQLPGEARRKIAWGNAARLFGTGGVPEFRP